MKKVIQYGVSALLAGGLLWYVFKGIDLAALWQKFLTADSRWVVAAAVLALLAHVGRAARWQLMLAPLGYRPGLPNTTIAVLMGYLINLALPRAGELARCGSLQRSEGIPFQQSFGTVVAERLIDVLVLGMLIIMNLLLEFDRISQFFFELMGEKFKNPLLLGGIAAAGILLLVVGWQLLQRNRANLAAWPPYQKVAHIVEGLWSGFTSVRNLEKPGRFLALTALIWLGYYFSTYALCLSLSDTASLTPLAVLTILVMGSIGMAAPTVGGIGSYHFLVGKIVMLYGLTQQAGITLATFLHAMTGLLFVVVFGGIAFLLSLVQSKRPTAV